MQSRKGKRFEAYKGGANEIKPSKKAWFHSICSPFKASKRGRMGGYNKEGMKKRWRREENPRKKDENKEEKKIQEKKMKIKKRRRREEKMKIKKTRLKTQVLEATRKFVGYRQKTKIPPSFKAKSLEFYASFYVFV